MKHPNINTVFVVDDDPIWRTLLVNMLKEIGYQNISAFESGPSCLYHLHKEPDLVFVDYSMSEMNGIELLQQIRDGRGQRRGPPGPAFVQSLRDLPVRGQDAPELPGDEVGCQLNPELPPSKRRRDGAFIIIFPVVSGSWPPRSPGSGSPPCPGRRG